MKNVENENRRRRALILVVDLDDDVGRMLGSSLVVGFDKVMDVAVKFALEKPEDADVNAMFAGLNLYRRLSNVYDSVEIAVVGGHEKGGIQAQRNLKERVESIVNDVGRDGLEMYLISDGEDEIIVGQVLSSVAPIAGVKRVIVSQHLGIESNYILILRYLKKVAEEPRLSLYFLGIPGFIIAVASLLSMIGLFSAALKLALFVMGTVLMIYGFGLEDSVKTIFRSIIGELREKPHIKVGGAAVVAITLFSGLAIAYYYYTTGGGWGLIEALLAYTMPLTLGGATIYILIKIIVMASGGEIDVSKHVALAVVLGFSALAFYSLGTEFSELMIAGVNPPEAFLRSIVESRFLHYIIVGAGIAGIIEIISRAVRE